MQVKSNSSNYSVTNDTKDAPKSGAAKSAEKKASSQNSTVKKEQSPKRITDQIYARFAENEVSLSARAKKLSAINQKFFSGIIKSSDIPMLKQRLFEEGFISDKDYAAMGGKPEKIKALKQAMDFVRGYSETLKQKDPEAFKGLQTVLAALKNMSQPANPKSRQTEKAAISFLQAHAKKLKETNADESIQKSVNKILEQLQKVDATRSKQAATGAINSYASIQNTAK